MKLYLAGGLPRDRLLLIKNSSDIDLEINDDYIDEFNDFLRNE